MHSYAQTNIQLYSQLERNGYSEAEILSVRDVYDVAVKLFTCRYQRSGKSTLRQADDRSSRRNGEYFVHVTSSRHNCCSRPAA
jgi:hypothetical protein